jgi:hypothetical protein
MPLPVTATNVGDAYRSLRDSGVNTISYVKQVQAGITANAVSASFLLTAQAAAISTLGVAQSVQADTTLTAALIPYVQQQVGNPTLDVAAELTASMTALGALVSAIVTDYPKDANGYLLDRTFNSTTGTLVWVSVTGASLPNTNAAITAWLATVS